MPRRDTVAPALRRAPAFVGFAAAAVLVWARPAAAIEALDVPLDHWAYEFLERVEIRAGLQAGVLALRPLTRGEMADLATGAAAAARAGRWRPTAIESSQIEMLRREFAEELRARGDTLDLPARAYHDWNGRNWRFQVAVRGRERIERVAAPVGVGRVDARTAIEPTLALELYRRFVFAEQVFYRVRTSDAPLAQTTDPRDGEAEFVFEPRDRFAITRTVEPYVRFATTHVRADLGRFRLVWGPGRHNALLLADATPAFDQVKVQARYGRMAFTSVVGQLRAARLLPSDPELRERYVSAHRLAWTPHPRLQVALSEALVWGDRGLDLAYVNPLTVLFVSQANNGDVDNALAGFDWSFRAGTGLGLYGECVIDDLNLRRGLGHFGNKIALLGGALWQEPFGAGDWDAEFEWSWASQFTYTHVRPIDRYQHFGGTLGSRTGPDSDLWVAGVRRRLSRGWSVRGFYELERHGEGGIGVDHDQRTSDRQEYLSGVAESRHQPGVELRYRALRSLDLLADARWVTIVNPSHDASARRRHEPSLRWETRLDF
jgi:hypothetical protein